MIMIIINSLCCLLFVCLLFLFYFSPRCLIAEKKAKKDKAPLTDRLMAQALALQLE